MKLAKGYRVALWVLGGYLLFVAVMMGSFCEGSYWLVSMAVGANAVVFGGGIWLWWWSRQPGEHRVLPESGSVGMDNRAKRARAAEEIVRANLSFSASPAGDQGEEDKRFEGVFLEGFGSMLDKHFYTTVAGVSRANKDGVSRQELISHCGAFDSIKLAFEPDNPVDPNAVMVLNAAGQQLGYLKKEVAHQIAQDYERSGRIWLGVVRRTTLGFQDVPMGLVLCLYRLSEGNVQEHVDKSLMDLGRIGDRSAAAMIRTGVSVSLMSSDSQ